MKGTTIDRSALLSMLETMQLIRTYEEHAVAMQAKGQAAGTCTSVGQEASAVGVVSALGGDDLILTNHRSAGHLLARGADPARIYAEVLGKATGYCKGRSGSLHVSVKDLGVVLTSTIVGAEPRSRPASAWPHPCRSARTSLPASLAMGRPAKAPSTNR